MAPPVDPPDLNPTPTEIPNPFHLAHAISKIKSIIPVTLDIQNPNYLKWCHFISIGAGQFSLSDLLYSNPRPPTISANEWQRGAYLLQSWIYGTISDDLSSMILSKSGLFSLLSSPITRLIGPSNYKKSSNP